MRSDVKPAAEQKRDAFTARMLAQCWEIRQYRQHVADTENRWLTLDEAAAEWVARYADSFDAKC